MQTLTAFPCRKPTKIGIAAPQRVVCASSRFADGSPMLAVNVDGTRFASVPTRGLTSDRIARLARMCSRLGADRLSGVSE